MELKQAFFILRHGSSEGLPEYLKAIKTIEDNCLPRHGRWVHAKTYYESDECNCSLCGQLMTTKIGKRMNYCPNCGGKMDGDSDV